MTEKILPYDKSIVPQERYWDCGPASTQVLLSGLGIQVSENDLIREIGTDEDGTDFVGLIENYLDRRLPNARYTSVYLESDPPTQAQKDALWRNVTQSIDAGYGVIMNWVSPPGNRPRAIKGSEQPWYGNNTVFHYVACMGYSDNDGRAYWIPDPGFKPFGYWVPHDGQGSASSLIPPKGYCYANVVAAQPKKETLSRDQYAAAIISEGQRARSGEGKLDHPVMTERGITIALATALVESNLRMYANNGDPESLNFPYDAISSDFNSTGLFQQRAQWWGTIADRMDASRSAAMFYNALSKLPYNDTSKSPGSWAQAVQRSAFPSRYDEKYAEAEKLYGSLVKKPEPTPPPAPVPQPNPVPPVVPTVDTSIKVRPNVVVLKTLAELGDRDCLSLLSAIAGLDVSDRSDDVYLARKILSHVESTRPSVLTDFLKGV